MTNDDIQAELNKALNALYLEVAALVEECADPQIRQGVGPRRRLVAL